MNKILKLIFVTLMVLNFAHADYLEVTLLGTGTPRPSVERFGSATLVYAGGQYLMLVVVPPSD